MLDTTTETPNTLVGKNDHALFGQSNTLNESGFPPANYFRCCTRVYADPQRQASYLQSYFSTWGTVLGDFIAQRLGYLSTYLFRTEFLAERFDDETHHRWLTDADFKAGYLEDFNNMAQWINEITTELQKYQNPESVEHQSLTDLLTYTKQLVSQMLQTMQANNPDIYQALYCDETHDLKPIFPANTSQSLGM